jgi:Rrf2 family iron-sulfur cluster assembly transcriptional regulator
VVLTSKGQLGLKIMMRLALHEGNGFIPLATLADDLAISIFEMRRPVGILRDAGLIRGERGWNGGYILTRPAANIRVSEILLAIDHPIQDDRSGAESLYGKWDDVGELFYDFLAGITLRDAIEAEEDPTADSGQGIGLAMGSTL